jgi:hypothetical protein
MRRRSAQVIVVEVSDQLALGHRQRQVALLPHRQPILRLNVLYPPVVAVREHPRLWTHLSPHTPDTHPRWTVTDTHASPLRV